MRYVNKSLDHDLNVLRGVAACLVFVWHYIHHSGLNNARELWSVLPFFTEGHVGVSLFMVLSGYLFAAILTDKRVDWLQFWKNRFRRIVPLLAVTQVLWFIIAMTGDAPNPFENLLSKLLFSELEGAAWSIATELHYYLLLPLILILLSRRWGLALLALAIAAEVVSYYSFSRDYTYHGILGRLNQFVIGGLIFLYLDRVKYAGIACIFFWVYLIWFDWIGGHFYYRESDTPILAIRFTLEGIGFSAVLITLKSCRIQPTAAYRLLGYVGEISYSLYLWHLFVLGVFFRLAGDLPAGILHLSLMPVFLATTGLSHLSYRYIELPFLTARTRYTS